MLNAPKSYESKVIVMKMNEMELLSLSIMKRSVLIVSTEQGKRFESSYDDPGLDMSCSSYANLLCSV